ncbi:MAG: hypothetical protein GJ680_07590 [Alteromonadaceae bacterium]|nr:hypothetical protein [Alteromonadaceae bacterium]
MSFIFLQIQIKFALLAFIFKGTSSISGVRARSEYLLLIDGLGTEKQCQELMAACQSGTFAGGLEYWSETARAYNCPEIKRFIAKKWRALARAESRL